VAVSRLTLNCFFDEGRLAEQSAGSAVETCDGSGFGVPERDGDADVPVATSAEFAVSG